MDARELLSGLSLPAAFPRAGDDVRVIQTHISLVFLTGDRVYKVKKTLSLWGFLDYSTLEKRRFLCEEEVRLNRRLAPGIYLGVLPVVRREGRLAVGGVGEVVDWAVEMVRIPDGATLADRIRAGSASVADVEAVAERLARFHAEAARGEGVRRNGRPVAFARILRQNFAATRAFVPATFAKGPHADLARWVATMLRTRRGLLARRARDGRLVEGHGDLRCEHVVRLEGGWGAIDGIEFSPLLRSIDPLSDAAFLAMDLVSMGRRDLSEAFLAAFARERPDPDAARLLPLYLTYRAHVRAKVDAHRSSESEVPAGDREAARRSALRHFALAWTFARSSLPPVLVLVAGPSGTGKSVLARFLAPLLGAVVVSSDRVRKRLAGLAETERATGAALDRLYSKEMSARTYATLLLDAERALSEGKSVILDATYLRKKPRAEARALAERLGSPFAIVMLEADPAVVRERLASRAAADTDPSDATFDVYEKQVGEAEPIDPDERPRVAVHRSTLPPEDALSPLFDRLR